MVFKPTHYLTPKAITCVVAPSLLLIGALTFALSPQKSDSHLNKNQDITLEIVKKLDQKHFVDLSLDDDLSAQFLDNYIDRLDPNKAFFYQSDIDEFSQYRSDLDNLLKKGDNSAGFVIYSRFKQRLKERLEREITLLKAPSTKFDFTKRETVNTDTQNTDWLKSPKEGDEYWRKRIKSFLLSQKLSDETLEGSKKELIKRYSTQLSRLQKNSDDDIYENYINAFAELYDPHTSYLAPRTSENFDINMSLSLEGIGAVLQTEDEYTKVVRLVTGGPAFKQGELKAADLITGVAQGTNGEMQYVVGWRLDEVVALIRGKKGSTVRLQVESPDATQKVSKTIIIKRDKVKLEDQAAQKASFTIESDNHAYKVGVINVPGFYLDYEAYRKDDPNYRSTTRDVRRLINELKAEGVDGIVLDLRNNGGGSLHEARTLTDLFIDKGPVVQIGKGVFTSTQHSRNRAEYSGPLVVMINRLSASASEIFAGAIQDYQRGLIVGSQSFGKGTVQSLTPLNSRGKLKITESKFYRVSGESTQHRGVIPDITFPELLDKDKIGESSYDTALEWSKTRAVHYSKYLPIQNMLAPLTQRHNRRIAKNPDFVYLSEQKQLLEKFIDKETISLNENIRREEKQQLEQASLSLENQRRQAKGLSTFKAYEDLKKYNEEKSQESEATAGTTVIDTDEDAMLQEAGYILKDFTEFLAQGRANKMAKTNK